MLKFSVFLVYFVKLFNCVVDSSMMYFNMQYVFDQLKYFFYV